jgi:hypothetical protein
MAQQRKNIARLILQGIGILGLLCGGMLVIAALGIVWEMQRENLPVLCGSLALSAALLVLGVYLTYTSYLMLRLRAFTVVVREIPVLLGGAIIFGVAQPVMSFADTLAGEKLSRYVKLSCAFVSLILFFLCISVCTRLSKRLVEVAGVGSRGDCAEEERTGDHHERHEDEHKPL